MHSLVNNIDAQQYEFHIGEFTPHIAYKFKASNIFLTHTEVPDELAGAGIASMLLKLVLEDISNTEFKIVPLCPFILEYIRRHPEWQDQVHESVKY